MDFNISEISSDSNCLAASSNWAGLVFAWLEFPWPATVPRRVPACILSNILTSLAELSACVRTR